MVEESGIMPYESREKTAYINRLLIGNGLQVYQLSIKQNDLENVFIKLTSDN